MYIKVILAPRWSHMQAGLRSFPCIKAAGKSPGTCGWAGQKKKELVRENVNYRKILFGRTGQRFLWITIWTGSQCKRRIWMSILIAFRHYEEMDQRVLGEKNKVAGYKMSVSPQTLKHTILLHRTEIFIKCYAAAHYLRTSSFSIFSL